MPTFAFGYALHSLRIRSSILAFGFLVALIVGVTQTVSAGEFLLWVMILAAPGYDLRRATWEQWKVRGLTPAAVSAQSILIRWLPAALVLCLASLLSSRGEPMIPALANLLLVAALGVLVGRIAPSPWILIPLLWTACISIPVLSQGRFLIAGASDREVSFSMSPIPTALVAFAVALGDAQLVSLGRPVLKNRS